MGTWASRVRPDHDRLLVLKALYPWGLGFRVKGLGLGHHDFWP